MHIYINKRYYISFIVNIYLSFFSIHILFENKLLKKKIYNKEKKKETIQKIITRNLIFSMKYNIIISYFKNELVKIKMELVI